MKVKYTGPAKDYSGYGEANRHDIAALHSAGIEITTELPTYTLEISDYGKVGRIAVEFEGRNLGYKVKILHTTPNVYRMYMEPGKYHIGRVFWETDKLPLDFAQNVQLMDEIWTGSQYNKQAIINAGVTKPIFIIPEAVDTDIMGTKPYVIEDTKSYNFYSIFEWSERKNPLALLTAYWQEFENTDNVALVLKTYIDNFLPSNRIRIDQQIRKLKLRLGLKKYAPIYLYRFIMERNQVYRFHRTFDCFVSSHRGEGWGIPQMEALLVGNPIISTNCGGIHEYLINNKHGILLDYNHIPVNADKNKQWYTPDQKWADVDILELRRAMRFIFENKKKAQAMGRSGSEVVKTYFSLEAVGKMMHDRLKAIYKSFEPQI